MKNKRLENIKSNCSNVFDLLLFTSNFIFRIIIVFAILYTLDLSGLGTIPLRLIAILGVGYISYPYFNLATGGKK